MVYRKKRKIAKENGQIPDTSTCLPSKVNKVYKPINFDESLNYEYSDDEQSVIAGADVAVSSNSELQNDMEVESRKNEQLSNNGQNNVYIPDFNGEHCEDSYINDIYESDTSISKLDSENESLLLNSDCESSVDGEEESQVKQIPPVSVSKLLNFKFNSSQLLSSVIKHQEENLNQNDDDDIKTKDWNLIYNFDDCDSVLSSDTIFNVVMPFDKFCEPMEVVYHYLETYEETQESSPTPRKLVTKFECLFKVPIKRPPTRPHKIPDCDSTEAANKKAVVSTTESQNETIVIDDDAISLFASTSIFEEDIKKELSEDEPFRTPEFQESDCSNSPEIHKNVIDPISNWIGAVIPHKVQFDTIPPIFRSICFYYFFLNYCNKYKCARAHYIHSHNLASKMNPFTVEKIKSIYYWTKTMENFYSKIIPTFIVIFSRKKMTTSLVELVCDLHEKDLLLNTDFLEQVIKGIEKCKFTNADAVLMISHECSNKIPNINDHLLAYLSKQVKLDSDTIEELLLKYNKIVDHKIITSIIERCLVYLPENRKLAIFIYENIIKKNLVDKSQIPNESLNALSVYCHWKSTVTTNSNEVSSIRENLTDTILGYGCPSSFSNMETVTNIARSEIFLNDLKLKLLSDKPSSTVTSQELSQGESSSWRPLTNNCENFSTNRTITSTSNSVPVSSGSYSSTVSSRTPFSNRNLEECNIQNEPTTENEPYSPSVPYEHVDSPVSRDFDIEDSVKSYSFDSAEKSQSTSRSNSVEEACSSQRDRYRWNSLLNLDTDYREKSRPLSNNRNFISEEPSNRIMNYPQNSHQISSCFDEPTQQVPERADFQNVDNNTFQKINRNLPTRPISNNHNFCTDPTPVHRKRQERVRPLPLELSTPKFGNPVFAYGYVLNESLHNMFPNFKFDRTEINDNDIVSLDVAIQNADGLPFLQLCDQYSTPCTMQNFITQAIASINASGCIYQTYTKLLAAIKAVNPYFLTDNILKPVLEVITINLIMELRKKRLWTECVNLFLEFCDWDSLLSSKIFFTKFSLMGRYIFLANIFSHANRFDITYEILQSPKLKILQAIHCWPFEYYKTADMQLRNQTLRMFFTEAYKYNIIVVSDMYKKIFLEGPISYYDALQHFNPMITAAVDDRIYPVLKQILEDIDIYYLHMDSLILRAFFLTIILTASGKAKEILHVFQKCVERNLYPQFSGMENKIVIYTNYTDDEIRLILEHYFKQMIKYPAKEIHINIELPPPVNLDNKPKILRDAYKSISHIYSSIKTFLEDYYQIKIRSFPHTNITIKHETIHYLIKELTKF